MSQLDTLAADRESRFALEGTSLRAHAARGTVVNAGFEVGLGVLGIVQGFVLAAFLTRRDYGVWGLLSVALGTLLWLKQVGIGDKYIQQDEADQELAFQRAFTLETLVTCAFIPIMAIAVPFFALIYGRSAILGPGWVLVAVLPAVALQTPTWVFYRRMRFVRQRAMLAVGPVVTFVVAVSLAVAGAGYWSLVAATVAGVWAGALAAVVGSPYRLRFRFDRATTRSYVSFSWPLFVASAAGMMIAQVSALASVQVLGLAGTGSLALAATISQFANNVDQLVTGTLYPAICAVRERTDLLFESFAKSNRLAMTCAFPFCLGVALFAGDLVSFGIGEQWRPAIFAIEAFAAIAAINQIGFNWDAYFRARGNTRPLAVTAALTLSAFLVSAIPLLLAFGLDGFCVGVAAMTVVNLLCRSYYLTRLFPGFAMVRHGLRAIAPTVLASAAVLALRLSESGRRTVGELVAELLLFGVLIVGLTIGFERPLLREVRGYLRRPPAQAAVGEDDGPGYPRVP